MGLTSKSWTVLVAFVVLATGFAVGRVPYDDEWFSLTLLTEASETGFWYSLARDMHPPWLATLDRALWSLWPERLILHLPRALACALAAALWLSVLRPRLGRWNWLLALALFHPIVFYYGAAHRWYPILLLGHALRHWAILSAAPSPARQLAFGLGALVGAASSYLDMLFLLHDGAHYLYRERARPARAALTCGASLLVAITLLLASPIAAEHWEVLAAQVSRGGPLINTALWAGLGPIGEAHPHAGLLVFAPLVALGALWSARALLRSGVPPHWLVLVGTLALTWLVATRFGVASPRYSLELWWLMTAALLAALALGSAPRWVPISALSLVALGLMWTLTGGFFFKSDLNGPPQGLCSELSGSHAVDAYVIPYHRIGEQVRRACHPEAELLQLPAWRHLEHKEALTSALRARVTQGGRLTLLALTSQASIRHAREAALAVLDAQCTPLATRPLWPLWQESCGRLFRQASASPPCARLPLP